MPVSQKKILIYGYGNTTREDDGIGIQFVENLEKWIKEKNIADFSFEINTQLNIEDAALINDNDMVFFIDASNEAIKNFEIRKIDPYKSKSSYTLHKISPSTILETCYKIYKKYPSAYLIHIKGYKWDFKEKLSKKAEKNLNKALKFFKTFLTKSKDFLNIDEYCT